MKRNYANFNNNFNFNHFNNSVKLNTNYHGTEGDVFNVTIYHYLFIVGYIM